MKLTWYRDSCGICKATHKSFNRYINKKEIYAAQVAIPRASGQISTYQRGAVLIEH